MARVSLTIGNGPASHEGMPAPFYDDLESFMDNTMISSLIRKSPASVILIDTLSVASGPFVISNVFLVILNGVKNLDFLPSKTAAFRDSSLRPE